jgi:transmembrane sensor
MSPRPAAFSRVETEASEWLVAMSDRTVSLKQRNQFEAWLRADPEHVRIYQVQKAAWSAVGDMRHLLDEMPEASISSLSTLGVRVFSPRARYFALAAVLLVALVGGGFLAERLSLFSRPDGFETTTAQVKDVKLEDGTLVTLGASSRIQVSFNKKERRVVLTRGEAFFEVTRDTARPFYVAAGNTLVRVVGTKFDVHYGLEAVRVSVVEGRVEVMKSDEASVAAPTRKRRTLQVLTAGEAAVSEPSGRIATANNLNTEDLGAWRQGRFVYVDAHLRDVIADINRYYDGNIEVADDKVGDLQLTTAFRADQIDRMLEVLERALPIEVTRTGEHRIVLSERAPKP